MDLRDSHRIQPALHHREDTGEAPRRVDEIQLAQSLGVVVLADGGGLLDVAIYGGDFRDANALQVHDGAACFEELAGFSGAGGEAGVGELFILVDQVLEHAFCGCDLVHGVEVDPAKLFDVDGSAVLREKL